MTSRQALAGDELLHGHDIWGGSHNDDQHSPIEPFPPFDESILGGSPTGTDSSFSIVDVSLSEDDCKDSEHSDSEYEQVAYDCAQGDGSIEAYNGIHPDHIQRKQKKRRKSTSAQSIADGPGSMEGGGSNDYDADWEQAGPNADAQDLAGPGLHRRLECQVTKPQKEGEGTQNAYVSYLVTTNTDFKSYQASDSQVRRRFTDFVFLCKTLLREYPQCAVPPLPDKHNMAW
ncbi:hypothetical protein B0A55_03067, partial [Friedmanniomyces simplex]